MILNANSMHIPLKDKSVQCCVTSPPYWSLRNYGLEPDAWPEIKYAPMPGLPELTIAPVTCCLGLESDPWAFVGHVILIFREVWRVLREDGTVWLNMGDNWAGSGKRPTGHNGIGNQEIRQGFSTIKSKRIERGSGRWGGGNAPTCDGLKPKDMAMIPARLALALQADGWYLRSDIIWHKKQPMPESVQDRPTKAHEYIFLLSKQPRYFYDAEAVKEDAAGTAHARGNGVNPKSFGQNSRVNVTRTPNGAAPQERQNESFSAAVNGLVSKRNARTVWSIGTEAFTEAHYATFPLKLAAKCIKAGTSEVGCCSKCGAPWERVIEKSYSNPGNRSINGPRSIEMRHQTAGFKQRLEKDTKTIGWRMTCKCDYSTPVSCVVLDPFGGASSTKLAAQKLGRRAISLELKMEYCLMGKERIYKPQQDLFI